MQFYYKLAVDGAFGSYSEASGGRLASLAYIPPPLATLAPTVRKNKKKPNFYTTDSTPHSHPNTRPSLSSKQERKKNLQPKKNLKKIRKKIEKNSKKKIEKKKNLKKKNRENFFEFFFFDFPKIFSVEIFHMMSTLRMQNFSIIG